MAKPRTRVLAAALVVMTAGVTACEPAPPPATFVVNSIEAGSDATPGDGHCSATPLGSKCTLQAALDEAIASGRGEVLVPPLPPADPSELSPLYPQISGTITGQVSIRPTEAVDMMVEVAAVDLVIEAGGSLTIESVGAGDTNLGVHGTFVASRTGFWIGDEGLVVGPTGSIWLTNVALLGSYGNTVVRNAGLVVMRNSHLIVFEDGAGLHNEPGGTTHLAASAIWREHGYTEPLCSGPTPISHGHNLSTDDTCGLTEVGDEPAADLEGIGFRPMPGSPLLDAIPQGVLGCGTDLTIDVIGEARPFDGNEDGVAACDIGAWEWTGLFP